jgi:hypothetical protein
MATRSELTTSVATGISVAVDVISRHRAIVAFLLATFILRVFLSDWNSYWNDEILSVVVYGVWNESALAAVERLANNSIHPPLFQFILYNWMAVFGDGETAARTLSNLYITLATLFLYLTIAVSWSKNIAFFSAAGFSLMNLPVFYALEARSYAQTIFLVTLSSWLVWRLIWSLKSTGTWSLKGRAFEIIAIISVNTALTLTHYYNMFWLLAQALFVGVFLLIEMPVAKWKWGLPSFVLIAAMAPLVFAALWGTIFVRQYADRASSFEVDGAVARTPFHLLENAVVGLNINAPTALLLVIGAVIIGVIIWAGVRAIATRGTKEGGEYWSYLYLASWLFLPLVVVYLVFVVAGVERYSSRYFVYCIPPLSALIIIALGLLVRWAWKGRSPQLASGAFGLASLIVVGALFVPTGFEAATERKHDWRGNSQSIVDVVNADPDTEYFILETGFNTSPRADYYFEQFSDDVRVDSVATRAEERDDDFSRLDEALPAPGSGERIILFFNHSRTTHFPNLLAHLEGSFELVHSELNRMGRGYVVFEASER